jgi:hypothetical protein
MTQGNQPKISGALQRLGEAQPKASLSLVQVIKEISLLEYTGFSLIRSILENPVTK